MARPTTCGDARRRDRLRIAVLSAIIVLAAAAAPVWAAGGVVSGKVDVTPAKFLEETVVFIKEAPGSFAPKTVDLDQKGKTFIPHVLIVTQGDTVQFLNHDAIAHNVFTPDHDAYNLGTFKPGETRTHTFKEAGVYTQLCSIHPEMLAFIFVGQNPYAATVDKDGRFTIKNVPPGVHQLAVWNSHLKAPEKSITVKDGQTTEVDFVLHR